MSDCKINLGNVGSRNKALRALTDGGTVYASEHFIKYFANKRPEDYLACLEIATKMIRRGPAFCLDEKHNVLKLCSIDVQYNENTGFCFTVASATLTRESNGKDWALTSLDVNEGPVSQQLPLEMYKSLWIKITPESMNSKEDWEIIRELTNAVSKDTTYIRLRVLGNRSEER